MRYAFDIDNTLVETAGNDYVSSKPIQHRIDKVNSLYDQGHIIYLFTARGSSSGKDYFDFTKKQMNSFGIKHHQLIMGKPDVDLFVDDKSLNANDWKKIEGNKRTVWTNGCFDVLHIGHIRLFDLCKREAEKRDAKFVIGIDSDEKIKRMKGNNRPFNNEKIRTEMLMSIKGVDLVVVFENEDQLKNIIKELNPELMIVGDDYLKKPVIGSEYTKELVFFPKVKGYSTTSILNGEIRESF